LGKAEEDSYYTAAENIGRKRLEVEIQAEENEERTRRREVHIHFQYKCTLQNKESNKHLSFWAIFSAKNCWLALLLKRVQVSGCECFEGSVV
jgi:uncharacterized OsmC-like protein